MSHEEAALWIAPLGVAVTHSPSVGSRSGCRAEVWAATSYGWNPGVREQRRKAGGLLLESSGSLYWPTRGDTMLLCVSTSRGMSQVCQRVSVSVFAGKSTALGISVLRCLFLTRCPCTSAARNCFWKLYPQQHLVIKFTFGR